MQQPRINVGSPTSKKLVGVRTATRSQSIGTIVRSPVVFAEGPTKPDASPTLVNISENAITEESSLRVPSIKTQSSIRTMTSSQLYDSRRFVTIGHEPSFKLSANKENNYMAPTTSEIKSSVRNTFIYA